MYLVVQLRSTVNVDGDVVDTLGMLNLHAMNHATLVPATDAYEGMLHKVANVTAWGEPSADVLATLLRRRAEPAAVPAGAADTAADPADAADASDEAGDGLDDAWIADHTDYDDTEGLAEALLAEETTLRDAGLKPTLRLHPPRKGHDGIKHGATTGGQLGRHETDQLDALLEAMR
jgi:large subunit ribosomal protein L30